ncbi:tetratricopeptide repeat protein [Adhaeribacter soli]|uniref:Tetratricopeptide repeat protein n=1 Tax=Adhaeribacter soli TaxID=2607655 RepID=A0A5N1J0P9_9BACT|nr:tetratricopeptide repeat protein [Adhaeribacter soli]KAA9339968.1 tetratricopeptide repeat protein [Adhaeribacter soli]
MRATFYLKTILFCLFLLGNYPVQAQKQTGDAALAKEYVAKGDHAKAEAIFEKLIGNNEQFPQVYPDYLKTLLALKKYRDAEKLVKKAQKKYPGMPAYEVDLGVVYAAAGNAQNSQKQFDKVISQLTPPKVRATAQIFLERGLPEYLEKTYLQGRKLENNPLAYSGELMQHYTNLRQSDKLMGEVLLLVQANPAQISYAQNMLQNSMKDEKEFEALERTLISSVQKNPNQNVLSELLLWVYLQRKDFSSALIQARALDRRSRENGNRIFEIGSISLKNGDYETAIEAFEYVGREYPSGPYYVVSRQRLLNAKEEQVKNTFPIDHTKIRSLIADYQKLLQEFGKNDRTADAMRNMAMLHAFYLDEKEQAINLLEEVVNTPRTNPDLVAQSKINLGDIYLLKGEPWEATLLYSQVEKSHKETPIGHEAKLRNARLSYYKGDFELAQAHLDILKLATSREIANDAMELSLLITDNTGLDTTTEAMEAYAAADLLVFQNKFSEAIQKLDFMLKQYPGHSLADEIYYQKAKIYLRQGNYTDALFNLAKITANHNQDILADDALFMTAKITEENLKDIEQAKKLYNDLLVKFPGSTYSVEARKRFRNLRGDAAVVN